MGIFVFIIGLSIGSFLNVCIYRIPREESISFPPSHCTTCGYNLKAYDLVPILSYLFLRGKCRKCGEKISCRYPLIELLNGLIYLLIFIKFGISLNFIFYSLLSSLLIVISFIDLDSKYIYTSNTILGAVIGCIYILVGAYIGEVNIINNLLGGIIGYAIIYLIVIATNGMGQGDAEIAGICGLFLGIKGILVTLFISIILGGLVGIIILLFKLKDKKSEIAFGPYIAIAAVICIFYGHEILSLYLSFFY